MQNSTNITQEYVISNSFRYFNTIFLCVVVAVALFGNVVALHAFFVSPQLKRITYYFIACLCVSDLLLAAIVIPIWIADVHTEWKLSKDFKDFTTFHGCLDIFCSTLSIMSLAMIGIERFICIKYALHYHMVMTNKRAYLMLACIVAYSLATPIINYTSLLQYDSHSSTFVALQFLIVFMSYALPVFIKLFTYTQICVEAKKQMRLIMSQTGLLDLQSTENLKKENKPSTTSRVSWTISHGLQRNNKYGEKNKLSCWQRFIEKMSCHDENLNGLMTLGDSVTTDPISSEKFATSDTLKNNDEVKDWDLNKELNGSKHLLSPSYPDSRRRSVSCPMAYVECEQLPKSPNRSISVSQNNNQASPLLQRLRNIRGNVPSPKHARRDTKFKRFKRELRATKVVGLIMGTFLLCWTPFMVLVVLTALQIRVDVEYIVFAKILHYLNSAINPILYVVLNKLYRAAVIRTLRNLKTNLFSS